MIREPPLRERVDRKRLEALYVHEGMAMAQIAARYGVSQDTVRKLLIEYDIPRRKVGR